MWLKALHELENLCSPWSVLYKKNERNELQAKLIKQEQAAVLQVVNYDQTNFVLFWVSAGVNNACQNNYEVDISLTNKTGSICTTEILPWIQRNISPTLQLVTQGPQ